MLAEIARRVRRNHGLEHATIHVLSEKQKNFNAQGNSDHRGFFLNVYGDVPERAVHEAVEEAYRRLKGGQHHLAVHPNCGTVLLTTATMATLAAQSAFALEQKRQNRPQSDWSVLLNGLPTAVLSVVLALIVSRPLGIYLQANYTTDGDLGDLQIASIEKIQPSIVTRFFQFLLIGSAAVQVTAYHIRTKGLNS
jgi:hypothetical protein